MSERIMPKIDHNWLVYHESIEVEMRKGAMSKAITEYFESIGFRQTQISPSMTFERGAMLASLYDPNPKHQKTHISIDIVSHGNQSLIELTMRINRLGNIPLQADYEFWRSEIDGLAHAIHYGYVDSRWSDYAAERAKWYSVVIMLGVSMVVIAVFFVLILGLLFLV
jgi:hypothetical protein